MKILRVTSNIYPEVNGGLELHTHHMSRIQSEMGHDVTVLTSDNGESKKIRKEKRFGYRLIRMKEVMRPFDNSIIPGIIKFLKDKGSEYDIIHSHSHLFFSTNVTALMSNFVDSNFVVTNHGLYSLNVPYFLEKSHVNTIGKFTFNSADLVFCYTDKAKKQLKKLGVNEPIKVVHNGIDTDLFRPINNVDEKNQILFVGRLKRGKGLKYLIDAFGILNKRYEDLTLKLVGDGPQKSQYENRCKELGISDNVIFTGNLPNKELPKIYNESLAFVSSTFTEAAVPRVVMEAWACETPVAITDISQVSTSEINGAGLTFKKRSKKDIIEKIEYLIENEDKRIKMGKEGRKRVQEKYSWYDTVEKTTQAYYKILN